MITQTHFPAPTRPGGPLRHVSQATWRLLGTLTLALVLSGPSWAAGPTMDGLRPTEGFHLRSALKLAQAKILKEPRCKRLFRDLRDDGVTLLDDAHFSMANQREETLICKRQPVSLFTTVGGERVGVCPGVLNRLDRSSLAAVLIHEALHLGGMGESPSTPSAPTSSEINRQVRRECSL